MTTQSPPKPSKTVNTTKAPAVSDEAPETDEIESPADDPRGVLTEYVVICAAIVYNTGKTRATVRRFMQGARLRLWSADERTVDLLASKSIGVRGIKHVKSTPLVVFRAMGAADDPIAAPLVQDILPIVPDKTTTAGAQIDD